MTRQGGLVSTVVAAAAVAGAAWIGSQQGTSAPPAQPERVCQRPTSDLPDSILATQVHALAQRAVNARGCAYSLWESSGSPDEDWHSLRGRVEVEDDRYVFIWFYRDGSELSTQVLQGESRYRTAATPICGDGLHGAFDGRCDTDGPFPGYQRALGILHTELSGNVK